MKKKFNPKLLSEEAKRFKLLFEYSFYLEEPEDDEENLILGSELDEADEVPNEPAIQDDSQTAANSANTGATDTNQATLEPNQPSPDIPQEPVQDVTATPDAAVPDIPQSDDLDTDEDVELDVTELVQSGEQTANAAKSANIKTSKLLKKFQELERRVSSMDSLTNKIDNIEKELVRRNPTPVEKLEMRSMDSFPYNIKLSDYFGDNDEAHNKKPEYILKKSDVDTKFVDSSIRQSFNISDDYEEEDIN